LANAETMLRAFGAILFAGTMSLVNYFENVLFTSSVIQIKKNLEFLLLTMNRCIIR
jgi:hypothetical protein